MEADGVRINPITLRFARRLEVEYQRYFAHHNSRYAQLALASGVVLFCLYGYLDYLLAPAQHERLWFLRFAVVTPCLCAALAFTFTRWFRLLMQPFLALVALGVAAGVVFINLAAYTQLAQAYFFGVIIINLYLHTFGRVQWQWAAPTSILNVLMYDLSLLFTPSPNFPAIVTANFFMLSTLILGMFAAYSIDAVSRREFVRTRDMSRINEQLRESSRTDHLTGLLNRRSMVDCLAEESRRATRSGRPFAVAIVDADHFKQVNDRQGHACGDHLLQALAQLMQEQSRSSDIVARWGGEEFLILYPDTRLAGARISAEKIRRAIEAMRVRHEGLVLAATVTIGLSEVQPGEKPEEAIARADAALYEGKRLGRNRTIAHVRMHPSAEEDPRQQPARGLTRPA